MATWLGLDIGSNSVGSAWVDTRKREVTLGVSVFPAGVDETDMKRGAPINQQRRMKRQLRRILARRATRRRLLKRVLVEAGLLPGDELAFQKLMCGEKGKAHVSPWELRWKGLREDLTAHEFGRVLVHLNQRRGAKGVEVDTEDEEQGAVKEAIEAARKKMVEEKAETFGELMAILDVEGEPLNEGKRGQHQAIRNKGAEFKFHADRGMVEEEFERLWERQKGHLQQLTDELHTRLCAPWEEDWHLKENASRPGVIFGQRPLYWDLGTMGRCDLEPTDRQCSKCDMDAQRFLMLEEVNRLRVNERGKEGRPLTDAERSKLLEKLYTQKEMKVTALRKLLGFGKGGPQSLITLSIELEGKEKMNGDWFGREIIYGVFGKERWDKMPLRQRESVNTAIRKMTAADKLRAGAKAWWGLSAEDTEKLVEAWRKRPNPENRMRLSRRAIQNLLPYMEGIKGKRGEYVSLTEAKELYAEDGTNGATPEQRERYLAKPTVLSRKGREWMAGFAKEHAYPQLPPVPVLSNPVVRKAIHEVRKHVNAYLRKFGASPERIVIELTRSATQTEKQRNEQLARNRKREAERRVLAETYGLEGMKGRQHARAIERIELWESQKKICPYSGDAIPREYVVQNKNVEVDHIIPFSVSFDNGFNNKVLCLRTANRTKKNQTPKQWLKEKFPEVARYMAHWKETNRRKWENLNADGRELSKEFLNSQLTDTAYAATQVASYLRDALYGGEKDGVRRVFTTKGAYTAILRRDWGLFETIRKRVRQEELGEQESQVEQELMKKDRGDHRHHAIDALVIACTGPETLGKLAAAAEAQILAKQENMSWPKRETVSPPWGTVAEFRRAGLGKVFGRYGKYPERGMEEGAEEGREMIVSHRAVKKRLMGAFHEDTQYGFVHGSEVLYTNRIDVARLTPNHLRMPEGWDEPMSKEDRLAMDDPPPGKSGLVRDRVLRAQIRHCLKQAKLNPDNFTKREMEELVESPGALAMASGIPIKKVVLLRTINDPVKIAVRQDGKVVVHPSTGLSVERVYIGGNNHHMEIVEDVKTGKWSGVCIDTFEAAKRNRETKGREVVMRNHGEGKRFVMSLSEGEMLYMKNKETGVLGYFVVFKLDKSRIHFAEHFDARPAKETEKMGARKPYEFVPADLKWAGVNAEHPPVKVKVGPLGEVRVVRD